MRRGVWWQFGRKHSAGMILGLVALVAVWHAFDFDDPADLDFPEIHRPVFSYHPPAAYRLAEPGDTLDRVALYLAAGAVMICLVALSRIRRACRDGTLTPQGLWPAALALGMAGTWYAATPGPTFDGWPGLGWRTISDPAASVATRLSLLVAAVSLAAVATWNFVRWWPGWERAQHEARANRVAGLLILALALIGFRQVEIPGLEPAGYWPRCALDMGLLAFGLALLRLQPTRPLDTRRWGKVGVVAGWVAIVASGILLTNLHRPLARLHAVVPGRIYISAMPSYRGLAIEQERLHFRTIINLFDEASTQASPYHADELRFVREQGLRYLGSPSDGLESDRFLDETLKLAQDPDAWPILVHCHGCMDRSPAWMGMYRFLVEHKPLADIYREIEQHRGTRPKAVVTLQYNRKLARRAPEQFRDDPSTAILQRCIAGANDPYRALEWNPTRTDRQVVRRIDPDPKTRRP